MQFSHPKDVSIFVRLCLKERAQSSSGNVSQGLHYKASSRGLVWVRPPSKMPSHSKTLYTLTSVHAPLCTSPTHLHRHEGTTTAHELQRIHPFLLVIATKIWYFDVSRWFPRTPESERWFQTVSHSTHRPLSFLPSARPASFWNSFLSKGKATFILQPVL